MKKDKKLLIITTIICLVPIVLGVAMYDVLPDNVSTHFDASGNADGFMPKNIAVWALPVIMAVINVFTHFMLNSDPKRKNASVAVRLISFWIIPVLSMVMTPITLFKSIGYDIPVQIIATAMTGVLITVMGNYMPKCKQNYTVGIKLPWTLNDEKNWNKTHRLAGYMWMLGGIVMIILSFMNINNTVSVLAITAVLAGVPAAYSYLIYKKDKNEKIIEKR